MEQQSARRRKPSVWSTLRLQPHDFCCWQWVRLSPRIPQPSSRKILRGSNQRISPDSALPLCRTLHPIALVGAPRGLDRICENRAKSPSAAALCRLPPSGFAGFASMPSPLRIGIAGLGSVGAAVITLLGQQAEPLARRTGRQIAITGVSVCHKGQAARDRCRLRLFRRSRELSLNLGDGRGQAAAA